MQLVIQRVKRACVKVNSKKVSEISQGLVLLVCCEKGDDEKVISWVGEKITKLRIFSDEKGKFNLSVKDVKGEVLLVSNFTVCGFLKKGTRPSFHLAESPEVAEKTLNALKEKIESLGIKVATGVFGAHMEVEIVNDGPVTLYLRYPLKNRST